jgi:cyclic pyranopterin phosphate synthase
MTSDGPSLTHIDESGAARMVDVGGKAVTRRRALAQARVLMSEAAIRLVRNGGPKGDVLQVARIAGIQGAKRTADLVPLCHPLPLDSVTVDLHIVDEPPSVVIHAEARTSARTGVEMEAMTAAAVAALTVYDMVKAADKGVMIDGVVLLEKDGGRSGSYRREPKTDLGVRPPRRT